MSETTKDPGTSQYKACMLEMARAVQVARMYRIDHPSAKAQVSAWFRLLAPLIRARGVFAVMTDGTSMFINGKAFSTTNPNILEVVRCLYTGRAGKCELQAGLQLDEAARVIEFLSRSDPDKLADAEHSLEAWIEQHGLRHVRVSELHFKEVKDGDRIVSGDLLRHAHSGGHAQGRAKAAPLSPSEAAKLARSFKDRLEEAAGTDTLPRPVQDDVVHQLRGASGATPEQLIESLLAAASMPSLFAELILKSALVEQEIGGRAHQPVGDEVVTCLRRAVEPLQEAPEAQSKEGWADLARTLDLLTECILERLQSLTGGSDADADLVRAGVRSIQHDLEGAALKHEYEERQTAFAEADRRIRSFFGLGRGDPV